MNENNKYFAFVPLMPEFQIMSQQTIKKDYVKGSNNE
jgi:hypothetical protein